MARAAGDDSHYTWELKGRPGQADIRLPSVTTVIKTVFGASFTPASKWGFKLGLRAAFPTMADDEFEKILAEAYESEHSPENVRDAAGLRGTLAHDYFELLADCTVNAPYQELSDGTTTRVPVDIEPDGPYQESVKKWWDAEMPGWEVVASEVPLVSLSHQFAGTVDLIRKKGDYAEVLDLKTHSGSARYEDRLQVAAYELAACEMGLISGADHRIVLAREDGRKAGQSTKYTSPDEFLKVLEVYKVVKGGGR